MGISNQKKKDELSPSITLGPWEEWALHQTRTDIWESVALCPTIERIELIYSSNSTLSHLFILTFSPIITMITCISHWISPIPDGMGFVSLFFLTCIPISPAIWLNPGRRGVWGKWPFVIFKYRRFYPRGCRSKILLTM